MIFFKVLYCTVLLSNNYWIKSTYNVFKVSFTLITACLSTYSDIDVQVNLYNQTTSHLTVYLVSSVCEW